ncbi:hypothetical protein VTP01DRAFT_5961 [Rhizomucor pusillus]|uniref:uncharacterized protein n=1 Tax=Rhizomucor pusillus TaxID=4840 RepID=UPI0037432299
MTSDHDDQIGPVLSEEGHDEVPSDVTKNYWLWKKNTPFLYDMLITHGLDWPSLTCQWFPDVEQRPEKNYKTQRLLLGTHTNDEEPNYLQIASVQLPKSLENVDPRKYEEITNEIGGYGGYNDAHIKTTQKIVHDGEVNRARYQYENPNIVATKVRTGDVYIFDRTMHESFPKEDEKCNPALRLVGHDKEGYGLEWNPHSTRSNYLISSGFDGRICHWDISAASREDRRLLPYRTYSAHQGGVEDAVWHWYHDSFFASVGDDGHLMIWDIRGDNTGRPMHDIWAHKAEANCVGFCPGSEWILATGSSDKTVALWDLRNLGSKVHEMLGHDEEIYQLAWSPHHDAILATGSNDKTIRVWDVARIGDLQSPEDAQDGPPELLFKHGGHIGRITDLCWNPAEPWCLASAAEDNLVQVWQMASTIYSQDDSDANSDNDVEMSDNS